METDPHLPAELEALAHRVDGESPEARELFYYAMVMLMIEDGKAKITERPMIESREHLTIQTSAGDVFTIVHPQVSQQVLEQIRQVVRDVLREEIQPPKQSDRSN